MKSEKWNEYSKAKVRNTLPKELPILTEKQWNKKGYVKISDDVGQLMRPNQMATSSYDIKLYLFPEEVRPATADELYVLKEPEQKHQLELEKAVIDEQKKYINEIEKLRQEIYELKTKKLIRKHQKMMNRNSLHSKIQ